MPALSIVIPTYNTAAMTAGCCRAVLASMPPGSEVIVVDDGSTDDTTAFLREAVPSVTVIRFEENRRFTAAANAGIAAARGRIILLLNSDALVEPGALSAFVAAFDADPRLGIAGARLLNPDGTPQWSGGALPTRAWLLVLVSGCAKYLPHRRKRATASSPDVGWVSGAAMAFRAEVWAEVGPLSDVFRFYAQDTDFCSRAKNWRIRILDEARVTHQTGATVRRWRSLPPLSHDPSLLWPDLLTWAARHYGRRWTAITRALLVPAALVRIAARRIRELAMRGDQRDESRAITAQYVAALQALRKSKDECRTQNAER